MFYTKKLERDVLTCQQCLVFWTRSVHRENTFKRKCYGNSRVCFIIQQIWNICRTIVAFLIEII